MASYGQTTYGGGHYAGPFTTFTDVYSAPWRFSNIRADLLLDETFPVAKPGEEATYTLALNDQDHPDTPIASVSDRYAALRDLIRSGYNVSTYQTPGGTFFRQLGTADNLVRIEPLAPGYPATGDGNGNDPPTRDTEFEGRWAVVVGGEDQTQLPEADAVVELETVTIAPTSQFDTRAAVEAARERSDL